MSESQHTTPSDKFKKEKNIFNDLFLSFSVLHVDFRLHVSVFFRGNLVREVTTSSPKGCHITPCSSEEKHYLSPEGLELVPLPVDSLSAQRRVDDCPPSPPSNLERGVFLWMAPDGLYARRMCQSRVYWQSTLSPYGEKPNKLDREVICKLLHTQDYLTGETAGRDQQLMMISD